MPNELFRNTGMIAPLDSAAFDRGTDPLLQILTPEQARQIVAWQTDESLQDRVSELAAKANEGELSSEERAEYEGYIQANDFVALLQAKARRLLSGRQAG
jgi:hypothetical protein